MKLLKLMDDEWGEWGYIAARKPASIQRAKCGYAEYQETLQAYRAATTNVFQLQAKLKANNKVD